jgi:hypothetical protein
VGVPKCNTIPQKQKSWSRQEKKSYCCVILGWWIGGMREGMKWEKGDREMKGRGMEE